MYELIAEEKELSTRIGDIKTRNTIIMKSDHQKGGAETHMTRRAIPPVIIAGRIY